MHLCHQQRGDNGNKRYYVKSLPKPYSNIMSKHPIQNQLAMSGGSYTNLGGVIIPMWDRLLTPHSDAEEALSNVMLSFETL